MPETEPSEHLRGPWQAVLAEEDGTVYPTVEEAIEYLGHDGEVQISVVRGTAAPTGHDGTLARLPGTVNAGDVACETDAYLVDEDDESLGAHARFEQAKAMADGLNAAWRANEPGA
jgi:hypothetical protein